MNDDVDSVIEGAIYDLWAPMVMTSERRRPTARRADEMMRQAVSRARKFGAGDIEIREAIRLNLATYGIDPETAPIDVWLAED